MAQVAADLIVKMRADTKDAEGGIQRVSKGISGFAKSAAAIGTGILGTQAFNILSRGFAGATAGALDFGKQMANVNSLVGLSDGAFQALNDQVLALTQDPRIAQAPATLAAGLYDIYSSGFQGADGMKVLQQSALAATAGVTDTATAARVITANLNAFGLGADDAKRVSDVLFQTVADGVITFEQLANNMGNVIPIANSLGLGVEDVGAAYAQMTLKGVPAAQAETQIAGLMRATLNPTQALTDAVQAHGFASAAAAVEQKGLAGFLDIVNDAAGGNQETMFDLLGTQEAMNAATILGADGVKGYRAELDKMKGASKGAGATNKALEQQMKSASFQIAKAKQQVLTLATVGFGILAPVIGRVAGTMTNFISRTLIPLTSILGRATRANFTFGRGFDKLLAGIPQPLRRSVHAIASFTDALSDMWRHGFSRNEITQAFHAVQALGEEFGQAVHWTVNAIVDTAVSLGSLLINGIVAAPGAILDWVRGKLGLGAGVSQDPASPMYGQQGKSIDLGAWALNVGAPAVASAIGDIGDWLNRFLFNETNNQSVGPIAWHLELGLPTIGFPAAFSTGAQASVAIRDQLGDISVRKSWKLILAVPALLLFGIPAAIGGLIVKKLTGIGPIELTKWTLTVGAPSTIAFGLGVLFGALPNAIQEKLTNVKATLPLWTLAVPLPSLTMPTTEQIGLAVAGKLQGLGDINLTWLNVFDLAMDLPGISLAFDLSDLIAAVKDKIKGLGGISFDLPNPLNVNIPNPFHDTPSPGTGQGEAKAGGGGGFFQPTTLVPPKIPAPDTTAFDTGMSAIVDSLKQNISETTYTATIDANNQPATQKVAASGLLGSAWQRTTFTSTFDIDNGPAAVAYTNAFGWGATWAAQTFTARFAIDTSGLWNALAVAQTVAAGIAAVMPHSLAKKGPLSKPINFSFIEDAARHDLLGLGDRIAGWIGIGGNRRPLAYAGVHAGPRHITVNVHGASDAGATGRAVVKELRAAGF